MKNIMKEAHRMTKEIKKEFPNVDYKFQLGLCISYLYEESKKEDVEMVELKGSEKQVKWANEIREKALEIATRNNLVEVIKVLTTKEDAKFFIDGYKQMTSKYIDDYKKFTLLQEVETRLELKK